MLSRARSVHARRSSVGDGLLPLSCCFGSEGRQGRSGDEVPLEIEGVVDGGMHAEKSLGRAGRFEPLHLALAFRTV